MSVSTAPSQRHRQAPIARALYRLPVAVYRWRLGRLVSGWKAGPGVRAGLLVLRTRGRVSGAIRKTALEYREVGSRFFFVAGWGPRSDWVLNIERDPEVSLEVGTRVLVGRAHVVTSEQDYEDAFAGWRKSQPRLIRFFYKLFGFDIGTSEAERRRVFHETTVLVVDPMP